MRVRFKQRGRLMLVSFAILATVGCQSALIHEKVPAFSAAVATSMDNTKTAFEVIETEHYDAMVSRWVTNYDTPGVDPRSYLTPFLTQDQLEARITVLDGLKAYAEKLYTLTGSSQLDALDESTNKLAAALTTLNKNTALNSMQGVASKAIVSDSDLAIFATAVNALGHAIVEWKREKAIREAVPEMQTNIDSICDILAKDIGEDDGGPGLRNQLKRDYEREEKDRDTFLRNNATRFSPNEKRAEIEYIAGLFKKQEAGDRTLAGIRATLLKLRKTNQALSDAFKQKASLEELTVLIVQLKAEGDRVATYYKSVQATISK